MGNVFVIPKFLGRNFSWGLVPLLPALRRVSLERGKRMNKGIFVSVMLASTAMMATVACADDLKLVWGGGKPEASAYSGTYVPMAIDNLRDARLAGYAWGGVSEGCVANMQKVTDNPTNLAICQGDMVEAAANKAAYKYTIIREDLGFECGYMATALPGYDNFGHILGNAFDLTVHTTGLNSGSMGSFRYLSEIFPDLGDVTVVNHANSKEAAEAAKADADKGMASVAFFVQRPDPDNATFQYIADTKMTFVPVVDLELEDKYTFPELPVENAAWMGFGGDPKTVVTACTKVVLITGDPANLPADASSGVVKRLDETISRLRVQPTAMWQPKEDWFAKMVANMKAAAPGKIEALKKAARETAEALGNKIAN